MRLGARRPDLIRSLILMETSADPESPENVPKYRKLNFIARWLGLGLVAGKVMPIMFSRDFMGDPARAAERRHWQQKQIGRAHVRTPVNNAHLVCRLQAETKQD